MTTDKLIAEMDTALQFPGVSNAWTMPIKARIDMLSTGIRTPIGIKVFGKDLDEMEKPRQGDRSGGEDGARHDAAPSPSASPAASYLNIEPDRAALARYGLTIGELQDVIATALGGEMVTTTVEGRERFGVIVRYPRELRSRSRSRSRARCSCRHGRRAWCRSARWPRSRSPRARPGSAPRTRCSRPTSTSTSATATSAPMSPRRARPWPSSVKFPAGYYITWSGQFEVMERAIEKMKVVVPVTLLLIFLLLYLNFRRLTETLIVMLSVPFALVGGVWLMWLLGYNMWVAVAVGFIALAGVAAETGVVMLIYLDHAWEAIAERVAARKAASRTRPTSTAP